MKFSLNALNESLANARKYKNLIVGFSGGLDSSVLLHGVLALVKKGLLQSQIKAIHVNHRQNSACNDWELFCNQVCAKYGVHLDVKAIEDFNHQSRNINENLLRQARYQAFSSAIDSENGLLLAHHKDDQLETLLLRLNRGAGIKGLSAMQKSRTIGAGHIYRPLLDFGRNSLEEFAKSEGLDWIEDSSNKDTSVDRNFLRHEILPRIESRWPNYRESWSKSLALLSEAYLTTESLAQDDIGALLEERSQALDISELIRLPSGRQRAVIKHWLLELKGIEIGWNQLFQIVDEFLPAAVASPTNFALGDYQVSSFRGLLYLVSTASPPLDDCPWNINEKQELALVNNGLLRATETLGEGISSGLVGNLEVKFRTGGENFKIAGGRSKSLKQVLQEAHVEPWMRARTPLLFRDDELVCVVGIGVSDSVRVESGRKGYSISWRKPQP